MPCCEVSEPPKLCFLVPKGETVRTHLKGSRPVLGAACGPRARPRPQPLPAGNLSGLGAGCTQEPRAVTGATRGRATS